MGATCKLINKINLLLRFSKEHTSFQAERRLGFACYATRHSRRRRLAPQLAARAAGRTRAPGMVDGRIGPTSPPILACVASMLAV